MEMTPMRAVARLMARMLTASGVGATTTGSRVPKRRSRLSPPPEPKRVDVHIPIRPA